MAIKPIEILIKAKDDASGVFTSFQGKVAAVAAAVAGYFGIGFFKSAITGAGDLEAAMSRVEAATGATGQELKDLRKAADDAGESTKYTSVQAAGALENLAKAGLSAKDAIAALPAVLQLAQAGDIDLGQASEFVTKAVMGMGLAFTDAGRVADVLAKGANASNTSVTGLAQALSYAAPVAHSLGLSLETTVAIIGKFADAGIDASRAGTALNSILSQFSDPASKFREELGSAGIITSNFEQALRELAAAGPRGQKAILAVGTEAGPALRALLNQGIGALDTLKKSLDDSAGSAAATALVMQNNLNGAFDGLSSAWDTVKTTLGTPVLPVLKAGVEQLTAAIRSAVSDGTIAQFGQAMATAFQSAITWARGFAASIDFTTLTATLRDYATRAGAAFTAVGQYAANAGNTVQLVYGVMSAGANGVLVVVYGIGSAFAGVASNIQSGLALLYDGFAKVTFGSISASYKAAADEIRVSAGATWAASEELGRKAEEALGRVADGAESARQAFGELSTASTSSATAQSSNAAAIQSVATALQALGDKAAPAAQKQIDAANATRATIAQLHAEYDAAMAAGNVQLAVQKQQQLRDALQATGNQAKLTGQDLENAFTRLGVTSQAELAKVRDNAKRDFELIKSSGVASAVDIQNAFAVLAQRTLDASGPVGSIGRAAAQSALEATAAANGLSIQFDATGKVIVKAMGDASTAVDGTTQAVQRSAEQVKAAADAWDTLLMRYKLSADYTENQIALLEKQNALTERATELERKRLNVDKEGFSVDKNGNRVVAQESQASANQRVANRYGVQNIGNADAIAATELSRQIDEVRRSGTSSAATNKDLQPLLAELQRLESSIAANRTASESQKTVTPAPAPAPVAKAPTPAPAPAASTTHTVNLNIGGRTTAVKVATAADANALVAALAEAAGRAA